MASVPSQCVPASHPFTVFISSPGLKLDYYIYHFLCVSGECVQRKPSTDEQRPGGWRQHGWVVTCSVHSWRWMFQSTFQLADITVWWLNYIVSWWLFSQHEVSEPKEQVFGTSCVDARVWSAHVGNDSSLLCLVQISSWSSTPPAHCWPSSTAALPLQRWTSAWAAAAAAALFAPTCQSSSPPARLHQWRRSYPQSCWTLTL